MRHRPEMDSRKVAVALTLTALLTAGCTDPGSPCDVCYTEALAYGRVTDPGGLPVEGIKIGVSLSASPCSDPDHVQHGHIYDPGFTDGTGRYRGRTRSLFAPFTAACATVAANVLEDPAWTTVEKAFPTSLELREEGAPLDSARFDMVVEARSGG